MIDPARLRWAALSLRLREEPGLRRRILEAARETGGATAALRRAADPAAAPPPDPGREQAARREIERADRLGVTLTTLEDADYPPLLAASPDPPALLYVRGRLERDDALAIAVVGSRRATPRGVEVARRIAAGLAGAGFTVVSGLARGIDAAAHRGALEAGGRTLAVLGTGIDRVYPAEHRGLAGSIAARGAVLSEFPFGTPPRPAHFPERNRVIAWIAWATVVVEAARDSGSLITARMAGDEGRAVAAVPGPVDEENALGTNALLRDGALLCRGADDLIEDLAPQLVEAAKEIASARLGAPAGADAGGNDAGGAALNLDPDARRVLRAIPRTSGIGIERLREVSGLPPGPLLAALLDLEIRGLVRQLPGPRYIAAG